MKKTLDQNILRRSFEVGQKVPLYNSRLHLFPGKLKSQWTGPSRVRAVSTHGAIEIEDFKTENTQKVNSQWLKPFWNWRFQRLRNCPWKTRLQLIDHLLWKFWLKTVTLTLIRGTPLSFYFLFVIFVLVVIVIFFFVRTGVVTSKFGGGHLSTHFGSLHLLVLYLYPHCGHCVI